MRFLMTGSAALLCASTLVTAEKPHAALKGVKAPHGGAISVSYLRPAPDYVVTYTTGEGVEPTNRGRIIVWRRGSLFRQLEERAASKRGSDIKSEAHYSNIATGASASGIIRGAEERSWFNFHRETKATRDWYRYQLVRTGETRTIAGERCTIWRAEPIGEKGRVSTGLPRRACLTSDGIVLYDAWLSDNGEAAGERTATKIERSPIPLSEVLPPIEATDWSMWRARAGESLQEFRGRPINYDLELSRTGTNLDLPDAPDRQRSRAAGGWFLGESWLRGELRGLSLRHSSGAVALSYSPDSLHILYSPPRQPTAVVGTDDAPIESAPTSVLGEECRWFNAAKGVSDYWRTECRTADGLALIVHENSWGNEYPELRATSLSRGETSLKDLRPPASVVGWAAWGWPELEGRSKRAKK